MRLRARDDRVPAKTKTPRKTSSFLPLGVALCFSLLYAAAYTKRAFFRPIARDDSTIAVPVDGITRERRSCDEPGTVVAQTATVSPGEESYLAWSGGRYGGGATIEAPSNWTLQLPNSSSCQARLRHPLESRKIIVHYHMQHNAGTALWGVAKRNGDCATRACHQMEKQCFVSYDEAVEAANIRESGMDYVSYEVMLPPKFPLPYVNESARDGLFFTTIVRDPFTRLLTALRRTAPDYIGKEKRFWSDYSDKGKGIYHADNLNVRWLAGVKGDITRHNLNIAKCRLELFDFVMVDKSMSAAMKHVLCPMQGWTRDALCDKKVATKPNQVKDDPLSAFDRTYIGAWIERHRPSFELYDYARILSAKHLQRHGVTDHSSTDDGIPSHIEAMRRYVNVTWDPSLGGGNNLLPLTEANEARHKPPPEFCALLKNIWTSNADAVPNIYGIGSIDSRPSDG